MAETPGEARPAAGRLRIRQYVPEDDAAIARLNARFRAAGVAYEFYPANLDAAACAPGGMRERLFVAEQEGEIRGGVFLKEQPFRFGDRTVTVGWTKYPLAESLADKRYAGVPASLLLQLSREQPLLMALGMGGAQSPYAQLLARMGWTGHTVPTYFAVLRGGRVARELPQLRASPGRRRLLDLAAATGVAQLAGLAVRARQRGTLARLAGGAAVVEETSFSGWADEAVARYQHAYGIAAVRSAAVLEAAFPSSVPGVVRLRAVRGGATIGWAVVQVTDARGQATGPFGRISLGLLGDVFGAPQDAAAIMAAATRYLSAREVDFLMTSQAHPAWQAAALDCRYVAGPSNFAFFRSRAIQRLIDDTPGGLAGLHLTRGDGDGLPSR
jgi:hypothetical protein